jgi:hypothetical protein
LLSRELATAGLKANTRDVSDRTRRDKRARPGALRKVAAGRLDGFEEEVAWVVFELEARSLPGDYLRARTKTISQKNSSR